MNKFVFAETNNQLNWDDLQAQLNRDAEVRGGEFILDLTKVQFIDSLSIGNLLAVNGRLSQRNCKMKLMVRKGSLVERLLFCAKFDRIITINTI